jgi:hypothetical protein
MFLVVKFKSSLRKFYGRLHDLINRCEYLYHKWPRICSVFRKHNSVISSFMTYRRGCKKSNTTGTTFGAGTAYLSGALEFAPGFWWDSCWSIFSFLFSVLYIIVWPFLVYFKHFFVSQAPHIANMIDYRKSISLQITQSQNSYYRK